MLDWSFNLDTIGAALLLITCANLIYGGYVFFGNNKGTSNRLFFGVILGITAWCLSMFAFRGFVDKKLVILSAQALYASAAFIPFLFLFFSFSFPLELKKFKHSEKLILSLPFLLAVFLSMSPRGLIQDVRFLPGQENELLFNSTLHVIYAFYIVSYFSWAYINLYQTYKNTEGVARAQMKFVILGTLISTLIGVFTNLLLPFLGIFFLNWAGQIAVIFMVALISYAILKHHLFSIDVITAELFTFGLWITILVRTVAETNPRERINDIGLFVATVVLGLYLLRAVRNEVRTRQQTQALAEELLVANERLQQLDRQKSEFLSIASHQLRTPLTAMKGYSSMILEGSFGAVPEQMRDAVDKIFQSSQRLAKIIDEFLNVTRIELGTIRYDFAKVDFRELVQAVLDENEPSIKASGLEFSFVTEGSGSGMISADTGKLRQVLSNLVENAIRYTPKGSVHMILTLGLPGNKLRLSVADTGIGVPKETMVHLFEKFSRAQNAAHVNTSGSGLGLYVAREIIKAHKGRIWAESEGEGKGTVFSLELESIK